MGGSPTTSTTQSGSQTSAPWGPAQPYLNNVLQALGPAWYTSSPSQKQAQAEIYSQANAVPQFGSQGKALTSNLFNYNTQPQQQTLNQAYPAATSAVTGGVNSADALLGQNYSNAGNTLSNAYNTASSGLSPYLNSNYTNPMDVPGFATTLNAIGQQTQQATDSLFAAADRDPAGNAQAAKAAATATMNAEAPYLTNEYNSLVGQQQGAASTLGNLGMSEGGTLGQLGLGTGGTVGQLGLSEGGTLGNLATGITGALTGQQGQQFGTNLEGVQLAEGLPGLYTTPGNAMQSAANNLSLGPLGNLSALSGILDPIAGLGGQMNYSGFGQTQYPSSTLSSILGGGLGILGLGTGANNMTFGGNILNQIGNMIPSDIRLKDDVEPIGMLSSGVPLYTFRYKGDPETRIGPMAQEVERLYPEAVKQHPSGFKMVDYGAIDKGLLGGVL